MVTIIRGALDISSADVRRFKSYSTRRGGPIFNPDAKRLQAAVPKRCKLIQRLEYILQKNGHMEGRTLGSCVSLLSRPGCRQQEWHTDYDPDAIQTLNHKPLGVLLALQDDTFFNEHSVGRHVLKQGDILIFDGDVVHAGAAYTKENVRIHAYIDSIDYVRPRDKTYLLES